MTRPDNGTSVGSLTHTRVVLALTSSSLTQLRDAFVISRSLVSIVSADRVIFDASTQSLKVKCVASPLGHDQLSIERGPRVPR